VRNYTPVGLLLVAFLIGLLYGCGSRTPPVVTDPSLARNLLEAVYAGSVSPLAESLDPTFQRGMPDVATAGTAALLREQFGPVKAVELKSTGRANPLALEAVWAVAAEKSSFEMKLWFHEGKVSGVWFRPSSAQEWGPVPMIGVEYVRRNQKPVGW